jgi:hypothetical protein
MILVKANHIIVVVEVRVRRVRKEARIQIEVIGEAANCIPSVVAVVAVLS